MAINFLNRWFKMNITKYFVGGVTCSIECEAAYDSTSYVYFKFFVIKLLILLLLIYKSFLLTCIIYA